MTKTDDGDRLIQEVLLELGSDEDPKKIADNGRIHDYLQSARKGTSPSQA